MSTTAKEVWKGNELLRPLLVAIADLRPNPANPRRHDLVAIAKSLERFGQQRPVLARDGQLIAGHGTTLAAAEQLGWTHIAVLPSDLEGEADVRDFLLADNRTHDLGHYELDALADLLKTSMEGGTLEGTGYSADDVDDVLAELGRITETERQATDAAHSESPEEIAAREALRAAGAVMREVVLMLSQDQYEKLAVSVRILRAEFGTEGVIGTIYETVIRAAQNPEALKR